MEERQYAQLASQYTRLVNKHNRLVGDLKTVSERAKRAEASQEAAERLLRAEINAHSKKRQEENELAEAERQRKRAARKKANEAATRTYEAIALGFVILSNLASCALGYLVGTGRYITVSVALASVFAILLVRAASKKKRKTKASHERKDAKYERL